MAIKRKQLLEIADKAAEMGLVIPPSIMLDLWRKDAEEIIAALVPAPTPIFTLNEPGLVPPPGGKKLVLGSEGWIKAPLGNRYIMGGGGGGGGTDHSALTNLDYAASGHTGFQPAITASATYTETNVTTTRAYDANSTSIDEIADVLGTLIADLRALGAIK